MSAPSSQEEDLSSLVASYLFTVDVSLANSFNEITKAKPLEEHAPSLQEIYNHYKQCPTTLGVRRKNGTKRPAQADTEGGSDHSSQNNNGKPKNKMPIPLTAEVIDLTSWSDPDSQELQTPIKIRKIVKMGSIEISNEICSQPAILAQTPQVPINNILAPANIPKEILIRTPINIPQETNNNILPPANNPQETNKNIWPRETKHNIRNPVNIPQKFNNINQPLMHKTQITIENISKTNIPQETNKNIHLLENLQQNTTVKLEHNTNNDIESPVKIVQGIGCLCCSPRPGPSNWRPGEEHVERPAANTPVQQKQASPINLLTPEQNTKKPKFSGLKEHRSTPQHVTTFQGVQVRPQMVLVNPALICSNSPGDHYLKTEVTILQAFKDRLNKLIFINRNGLDPKHNLLRNELRQLLNEFIEWNQKYISSKQELQKGMKQLNDPTQTDLLEQVCQNQLKTLKQLQTFTDIQSVSPNRICEIAMNSVNLVQTQIARVRNPPPNGEVTYLSKTKQANNIQNLAIPKQTNDVQNLPRPEQTYNLQNLPKPEQPQNVKNIHTAEQNKYNLRQTLLRQQIAYNLQIETEPTAQKTQTRSPTLHSVIKLLNPDEINRIAAAQKKLQIHPQETVDQPRSPIRDVLPQTRVTQQVEIPAVPNPVKVELEEAPVIETAVPKDQDNYQELLELEQRPLIPNLDAFTCTICLCDCQAGEGVMLHECLHCYCRECLANLIRHCDDAQVVCPYREDDSLCGAVLQEREVRALVSAEDYEKRLAKTVRLAQTQMQDAFQCRTADCSGWCVHDANVVSFTCPVCEQTNCLLCKAVHVNETCAQYKQRIALEEAFQGSDGAKSKESIEKMIKKGAAMHCPQCRVVVIKDKGSCDWVQCSMCKCEICWATRGPRWGPAGHGDNSGGCRCRVGGRKCHPKCKNCH